MENSPIDFKLCSAFSLDVYRDLDRPSLPEKWSVYYDCPAEYQIDNYFGAAYVFADLSSLSNAKKLVQIVVAHRGTMDFNGELEDFTMWAFHKTPAQFKKAAHPFLNQLIAKIKAEYPAQEYSVQISMTGHSLGATLAELAAAFLLSNYAATLEEGGISLDKAFTFESPGTKSLIEADIKNGLLKPTTLDLLQQKLSTATADIDAINTCMAQTALVLQVCSIGYSLMTIRVPAIRYSLLLDHEGAYPLSPDLPYFFNCFTVQDQHKMIKMYQFWQAEKPSHVEIAAALWPVGSQAAFAAYTHYLSPVKEHAQYWDQYMQLCWANDPKAKKRFKTAIDFERYFSSHVLHLDLASDEANFPTSKIAA